MKGWRIEPPIGVSACRVDPGIVHPDVLGHYLAGVECDGAMYHRSAVAREREEIEADDRRETQSGTAPETAPGVPGEESAPAAFTEPGKGEEDAVAEVRRD